MKNVLAPVSLGRTGLRVSRLGMGVLPIGPNQRSLPVERGAQIIAHALARGINFIDTAEYYRAYDYIKKALRGGRFFVKRKFYKKVMLCYHKASPFVLFLKEKSTKLRPPHFSSPTPFFFLLFFSLPYTFFKLSHKNRS